ncbi:hypothetical protein ACFO1B_30400 [Dactylosporangium siamense]|uniref:Uncharacterized protein n=1 Tax=Dactylosporangium siamense TaxID=685454 RepID=A0A919PR59_9ACTN|nr:hypothetical protein [Dactylosporangium siamense]GIG48212.1 hypothetical protein Dsi01nite_062530 [Dactylosporangium siamense]
MSEALAALVRSFLDEPLRLTPDDPAAEWHANTVWFGVPDEPVDPAAVAAALEEVGRRLRVRFGAGPGPVTFYAWHDGQAGQLRCALRSVPPDELPFGGRHVVLERPDAVVALIAADRHPGVVLWEELSPATAEPAPEPPPFPVFAVPIAV